MFDPDQTKALAATKVTHGGDAQPKEDRREGHDRVDLPTRGHLLPLYIDRDEEERNK